MVMLSAPLSLRTPPVIAHDGDQASMSRINLKLVVAEKYPVYVYSPSPFKSYLLPATGFNGINEAPSPALLLSHLPPNPIMYHGLSVIDASVYGNNGNSYGVILSFTTFEYSGFTIKLSVVVE